MISVPLPHSYDETFKRALHRQHTTSVGQFIVGPSPFEIPESVEAAITSPQRMTLRFSYPNHESPEADSRAASPDGSVTCTLGQQTKKVLEVTIEGDVIDRLRHGVDLDPQCFENVSRSASRQTRNAFEQNLQVVRYILRSIPAEVLERLDTAIKKTWQRTSYKQIAM